jgi:SAM-dependent methyltransferase
MGRWITDTVVGSAGHLGNSRFALHVAGYRESEGWAAGRFFRSIFAGADHPPSTESSGSTPVSSTQIRFDDGAAYERALGAWSQAAGDIFLDWLSPAPGLRWLDVGCGNGAFTEQILRRCAPAELQALDPSEGQLAYARTRPGTAGAVFRQGSATDLPFEDGRFDAACMALVISFVPDAERSVREMARVVRPGGTVATYMWDQVGDGSPIEPIFVELRRMGIETTLPPSVQASRMETLQALWGIAGLEGVKTRTITVQRRFDSAQDYWDASTGTGTIRPTLDRMAPDARAELKARLFARLAPPGGGPVTLSARANAIMGKAP